MGGTLGIGQVLVGWLITPPPFSNSFRSICTNPKHPVILECAGNTKISRIQRMYKMSQGNSIQTILRPISTTTWKGGIGEIGTSPPSNYPTCARSWITERGWYCLNKTQGILLPLGIGLEYKWAFHHIQWNTTHKPQPSPSCIVYSYTTLFPKK